MPPMPPTPPPPTPPTPPPPAPPTPPPPPTPMPPTPTPMPMPPTPTPPTPTPTPTPQGPRLLPSALILSASITPSPRGQEGKRERENCEVADESMRLRGSREVGEGTEELHTGVARLPTRGLDALARWRSIRRAG